MRKLLVLAILLGCTGKSEESELHRQSVAQHELALKTSKKVIDAIADLEKRKELLSDSLSSAMADSIKSIRADWTLWEESIVEVPGHEHDHHHHDHEGHDHHHDHDHSPAPDLTEEMVLEIQQELVAGITRLDERVQRLIEGTEAE